MNIKISILLSVCILTVGHSYGAVIYAQPESREVYFYGEVKDFTSSDNKIWRSTYSVKSDAVHGPLWDGALIMAFRLPQVPSGYIIGSATLKWYYKAYYTSRVGPQHDIYGLGYRAAATSPLITSADHYAGTNDTTDATKIQSDVRDTAKVGQWMGTEENMFPQSIMLTAYLQQQYLSGASANDWVLVRFNPQSTSTALVRHEIGSCNDPLYAPYIEYDIVPATDGYYKICSLETPYVVRNNGLDTVLGAGRIDIGCLDITQGAGDIRDFRDGVAIFPFKVPQLQLGEHIVSAILSCNSEYYPNKEKIDLYGLPYRIASTFASTDYWVNFYAPLANENPNGTPISGDIFNEATEPGLSMPWVLDDDGSLRLGCYIRSQLASGATSNSFMFLRMNHRYELGQFDRYHRTMITSPSIILRVGTSAVTCPATAPQSQFACPDSTGHGMLGDANSDCRVDISDLHAVAQDWLSCVAIPTEYYCF